MNVLNVALGDFAMAQYRKLEDSGKIPKGTHLHEADRLKRLVEVIRRW